ncbi:MAG: TetR/AcrR family transcriptional regulator [Candidatus Humimicrobiaceae bacterium]
MTYKKENIMDSGRKLFSLKGFRYTKVSEIAEMAGISTGNFYNYYSSKKNFFLEIYTRESEDFRKSLAMSFDPGDKSVNSITKYLVHRISAMNSNLILKEGYNRDLFKKIEPCFYGPYSPENINKSVCSSKASYGEKSKSQKKIRGCLNEGMINAIFISILYINIHKREIGTGYFPQILQYITEFIMNGLAKCLDCMEEASSLVFMERIHGKDGK